MDISYLEYIAIRKKNDADLGQIKMYHLPSATPSAILLENIIEYNKIHIN